MADLPGCVVVTANLQNQFEGCDLKIGLWFYCLKLRKVDRTD
ncbi:hypothetical protein PG5_42150 [Pseudomonas sp. G5(2012)]|nr:hypothetical protein PG5_42150 [Pseudomonas sp. G5(2012)]